MNFVPYVSLFEMDDILINIVFGVLYKNEFLTHCPVVNYTAPVGVQSIMINLSVFVSVCPSAQNFVYRCPVAWLSPPSTALCYVMYFRFYG